MNKIKTIGIILSIALFLYALTKECYYTDATKPGGPSGLLALLTGWLDLHGAGVSWLANPFLLLAYIFIFKNEKLALGFGFMALCFSLSFLFFNSIVVDEAGHTAKISGYLQGYWFWLASIIVIFLTALFVVFMNKFSLKI